MTTTPDTALTSGDRRTTRERPGPLGRLAGVAYRRRRHVILGWLAGFALMIGLSAAFAGDFAADYSAPGSDSKQAQDLLAQRFPVQAGDTVHVVVRSDAGVTGPAVRSDVTALLRELGGMPHVAAAEDPYTTPGDISRDGKTLVSHLKLDVANPADMPAADSKKLLGAAQAAERSGLDVALGGKTIQAAEQVAVGSEGIGIAAAAIILLLTFGTVVMAGLPILVAVAGLAVSSTLVGLVAAVVDVPDWSAPLAAMMGIGIGIDYMLLTRFKEWRQAGLDPQAATVATLDTAGRSVLVAGSTVVVSMLGLFAMGLSFMRGAALVTIMAVLVVMAAAVTLFPALLGYVGRWVDRLRIPLRRRRQTQATPGGHVVPSAGWTRWSRLTGRHSDVMERSFGEMSVNSSDNSRQPRLISPAQSVLFPDPGGAGRIAAMPSRSITAAWRMRYWCAWEEMHQFIAHSSNGTACPTGKGSNGDMPS